MQSLTSENISVPISGIDVTIFKSMDDAVSAVFSPENKVIPGFALAMNTEKIMSARANPMVKKLLEMATFRYADGIGVVWALRRKGFAAAKIAGCELWEQIMARAGKHTTRVFLIGAHPTVLSSTVEKLRRTQKVNIVGYQDGYFKSNEEQAILNKIAQLKPEIVTVAMGSPRQEKLIAACRELHPSAFYMGVGGTYDVYVGAVKRAPEWALKYNIEWLYRLFQNPKRIKRQLIIIPYIFLLLTGLL